MGVLLGQMVLLELEVKEPQEQLVKGQLDPQELLETMEQQEALGPRD
jgi:hypothetical protein